jgi:predicted PurR-regulated permease PerM
MPTFRDKRIALQIAHDIERKLSRYFFTITVIHSGLGIAVGAAMWALGMPNPALFGVGAALLNFIPYLGAITCIGFSRPRHKIRSRSASC